MKVFISILAVLFSMNAGAQYGYKDEDIASRFKPGIMWFNTGWRPAPVDKTRKYDRLIIDAVYAMPQMQGIKQTVQGSFGWNINTMWDIPLTKGNTVSIGVGFSYRNARVGLKNDLFEDTTDNVFVLQDQSNFNRDKQLLGSHTFAVPLEIRFRSAKWKHLKINLGGYAGYQSRMYSKEWEKDNETVYIRKRLLDNNPLAYGVHARLGFRSVALFADYRLSKSFKSDKSTAVNFLTFGLSFSIF